MSDTTELNELKQLVATLSKQVESLQRQADEGHARLVEESATPPEIADAVTRRGWMKAAAAAAVGGTAVALSGSDRVAAQDTDSIKIGQTNNVGMSRTVAHHEGVGGPDISFLFKTDFAGGAAGANAEFPAALAGWSNSTVRPHGIHGLSARTTDFGAGVIGESYGNSGVGVYGTATSTNGTGLAGEGGAEGVRGFGIDFGVVGIGGETGVAGVGNEYGVSGRGTKGSFRLESTGDQPPTVVPLVAHAGVLYVHPIAPFPDESQMSVWCSVSDDGQWRHLAGPDTAGSLHPIEPTRVYDSRRPLPLMGKLDANMNRTFSVRHGRDLATGAITETDLVPMGARAVAYNLTITGTEGGGFLAVTPGGSTALKASAINWTSSNQTVANAGIVQVDGLRQLKVYSGSTGRTHFIVDITGYYL